MKPELDKYYTISKEVITKEIEGELVIVPLLAGIGDLNSEMYSLKTTGVSIWNLLDGTRKLNAVIEAISNEYNKSYDDISSEVISFVGHLIEKGLVVES